MAPQSQQQCRSADTACDIPPNKALFTKGKTMVLQARHVENKAAVILYN